MWIKNEIKNFLSLKKPDVSFGFFSDGGSGDKESFLSGLEGDMEGMYTGVMGRVDSSKMAPFVKAVEDLLKKEMPEMMENDWESYFAMWKMEDYNFFILAEFGSTDHLCSKLKKLVKDSSLFEEGSTSADELSYLSVPNHFKTDLRTLQKEETQDLDEMEYPDDPAEDGE